MKDAEDLQAVASYGDVKLAAKESGSIKWQEKWVTTDRGRNLLGFRSNVGQKIHSSLVSTVLYPN